MPFPAGGPTDGMARIISERLGAVLGQSIVIENRGGGAGGSIGAKLVATADPDGYTILITPGGSLTTGPAVHKQHRLRSGQGVRAGRAAHRDAADHLRASGLPVKTLAELVAYAKANPGKIIWGSQGFGTGPHLLAEMFKLETGVNIVHVPYRGTAPMLAAILAGEIQMVTDASTTSPAAHPEPASCARSRSPATEAPLEIAGRADHGGGGLSEAATRRSGSAWWRRPARRPPSSTSSTPRSAKAWRRRRRARGSKKLGADIKIGTPAGVRQDARRGTRAVDRRRQGRQHQSGLGLRLCRKLSALLIWSDHRTPFVPRRRGPRLAANTGFPLPRERNGAAPCETIKL